MLQLLQIPVDSNSIQAWVSIAQLLLSLGTIIFFITTFNLQAQTFKEQQKITNIEIRRYKSEVRPELNVKIDFARQFILLKPIKHDLLRARFKILEAIDSLECVDVNMFDENNNINYPAGHPIYLRFKWMNTGTYDANILHLQVIYEDVIGTTYSYNLFVEPLGHLSKSGPHEQ